MTTCMCLRKRTGDGPRPARRSSLATRWVTGWPSSPARPASTSPQMARASSSPTATTIRSASSRWRRARWWPNSTCGPARRTRRSAASPAANIRSGCRSRAARPMSRPSATARSTSSISSGAPRVVKRISVKGIPNRMLLNAARTRLYVTSDNADIVSDHRHEIEPRHQRPSTPKRRRACLRAATHFGGATPNSLALSPDGKTLYVTDGGTNALAIIPLKGKGALQRGGSGADRLVSQFGQCRERHALCRQRPQRSGPQSQGLHAQRIQSDARLRLQCRRAVTSCSSPMPASSTPAGAGGATICASSPIRSPPTTASSHAPIRPMRADGRAEKAHQARHLYRQGEPHLRSGAGRSRPRQFRSVAGAVRRDGDAQRACAGAAIS